MLKLLLFEIFTFIYLLTVCVYSSNIILNIKRKLYDKIYRMKKQKKKSVWVVFFEFILNIDI